MFIYPLLLGLLIAVNLGAAVIARRNAFRSTLLVANAAVALGASGFTAFDASSPAALPLLLMALIGAHPSTRRAATSSAAAGTDRCPR